MLPSVDIGTFSDADNFRLRGIIEAQVESESEEAKTAAHWQQLQEEDAVREAERSGPVSSCTGWGAKEKGQKIQSITKFRLYSVPQKLRAIATARRSCTLQVQAAV